MIKYSISFLICQYFYDTFCIKNFYYTQPTSRDEGSFLSRDTANIYFEKETSNAYYIRFNDCWSHDYYAKLPIAGVDASKKDFIIMIIKKGA